MVWPQMALAAVLRLARAARGKIVPRMTGGAGAERAVEIDAADARVGPGSCRQDGPPIGGLFDFGNSVFVAGLAICPGLELIDRDQAAVGGFEGNLSAVTLHAACLSAGHAVDKRN